MSELRKRAEHLSDRAIAWIAYVMFFLLIVVWIGLVALFSNLLGSLLAGATVVMVLLWGASFIVRGRIY